MTNLLKNGRKQTVEFFFREFNLFLFTTSSIIPVGRGSWMLNVRHKLDLGHILRQRYEAGPRPGIWFVGTVRSTYNSTTDEVKYSILLFLLLSQTTTAKCTYNATVSRIEAASLRASVWDTVTMVIASIDMVLYNLPVWWCY